MIDEILHTLGLSTLASSAAIVAVLLLRKPLRRRFGAQVAYVLWSLVPISAAIALLPAPQIAAAPAAMAHMAAAHASQAVPLVVATVPAFDFMPWLALAWLLGTSVCVALFAWQQRRFVQALGRLSPNGERIFRAQTSVGCPALIGVWRPRIVLPPDFEQRYDAAQRELILAHEHAHRQRGDAQANALAAALRCLYWFNPLMHLAAARFRFDQELACDASVLSRYPQARRSYADAMLNTQLAVLGLPAGCHWQSSQPLKERIAMLKQSLPGAARRRIGTVCVAAIVAAASVAAWAAQPGRARTLERSDASTVDSTDKIESTFAISIDGSSVVDLSKRNAGMVQRSPQDWDVELEGADGGSAVLRDGRELSLVALPGQTWGATSKRSGESWQVKGTPQLRDDGKLAIAFSIRHDGKVVSTPRLVVIDGEPSAVRIGDDSAHGLKIDFTLRKMTSKNEHKAQNEYANSRATAKISASLSTPVSYRRMTRIDYPEKVAVDGYCVVVATFGLDATGAIRELLALEQHGNVPQCQRWATQSAVTMTANWSFEPATKNGKPVPGQAIVPLVFTAHPNDFFDASSIPADALDAIRISAKPAPAAGAQEASVDTTYSRAAPPKYPADAIKTHQQGEIVLRVMVDADGNPVSAKVEKADPPEAEATFAQASIDAVMQWKFNPAQKNGKPVGGEVQVPFTYSLHEL